MDNGDLEGLAQLLESNPDYRVLRRIRARQDFEASSDERLRLGIVLDCETTGLQADRHEILEVAMIPFTYRLDGTVVATHAPFHGLREPSAPIPPEITRITGISDADVQGRSISPDAVAAFIEPAALIVAHNSKFDRVFLERFCPAFATKPWACSQSEIPWAAEGFDGTKLAYLAARLGLFYEAHRALDDCEALIEVLARPLPVSGATALSLLLARARQRTIRVWAIGAPFEVKDLLRARGYRWSDGADGKPRAWHRDVTEADLPDEIAFLHSEIGIEPMTKAHDAYDRFSDRV